MARSWQFVSVAFAPGILVGSTALIYAACQAFLVSECDYKFGCFGWAQMVAFFGATALVLSCIGLGLGCLPHRDALQRFTVSLVTLATALLTVLVVLIALVALLLWPVSVAGTAIAWVLVSAVASFGVVAGIRWVGT